VAIEDPLSERVIGCALAVQHTLGCGFLEKVYENAMVHECLKAGLDVRAQYPIRVLYDGVIAGEFTADLLVNQELLVELKAVKAIDDIHLAQCINYLKATGFKRCLLLNFGKPNLEIKRVVL
jgi:GxxExxY protein